MNTEATKAAFSLASKPLSTAVDLALSPLLERLRKWSERATTKTRISDDDLRKNVRSHIERLIHKSRNMDTLVFPHSSILIGDIYEPVFIVNPDNGVDTTPELLLTPQRKSIVVDRGGMGKSTLSKYLILAEISSTNRLSFFIELRNIPNDVSIIEHVNEELNDIYSKIDQDVVQHILENDSLFIILDGFDEIEQKQKQKRAQEISSLVSRLPLSTVIVTSRPDSGAPNIDGADVFNISPLTFQQVESLLGKYDALAKKDLATDLINEARTIPAEFLKSPLLVSIIYKTYSYNRTLSDKISVFYDEMFDALFKGHDARKPGFRRDRLSGLGYSEFRSLLRVLCFRMTAQEVTSFKTKSEALLAIEQASLKVQQRPTATTKYLSDLISSVPLMIKEGTEYKFYHRSLIEFFSAEYITSSSDPSSLLTQVYSHYPKFKASIEFVGEINPHLYDSIIIQSLIDKIDSIDSDDIYLITFLASSSNVEIGVIDVSEVAPQETELDPYRIPHEAFKLGALRHFHEEGDLGLYMTLSTLTALPPQAAWRSITAKSRVDYDHKEISKKLIDIAVREGVVDKVFAPPEFAKMIDDPELRHHFCYAVWETANIMYNPMDEGVRSIDPDRLNSTRDRILNTTGPDAWSDLLD